MKKVINITLGSIVFAVEQDAYEELSLYLEQIKNNLTDGDDAAEIVSDIERAIAEKFSARKRSEKMAITMADVESVIAEMGSPVEFREESGTETVNEETQATKTSGAVKKRLYRDADDVIVAGVASGLARYFDIDPAIVRLIFVLSIFFSGFGILMYLILWLVIPVAETTAEKYAMRGERVTLKDISERVKKNLEHLEEKDFESTRTAWSSFRGFLDKLFQGLGTAVHFLVVFARYVVGIALVVGGALGVASMVSIYSVILLSEKVFFPTEVQVALEVLQGSAIGIMAMASSFVMMIIPLVVLIVAGSSLLAKRNFFTVQKAVTFATVWIVAAVIAGTTSALRVEQVMRHIGPVEGEFHDENFEVRWNNGVIYGDDEHVRIQYGEKIQSGLNSGSDHKNTLYMIEGNPVHLRDGYSEMATIPNSAAKITTRYFGNELVTDLDGDGDDDIAFIVTQETDGTGVFYYAVAALNTENGYVGSDGYLLGDRVAPQATGISPNPRHKNVVVFNYADRLPNEPMSARPSVGKSVYLKLDPDNIRWGIVEPDFEGESAL